MRIDRWQWTSRRRDSAQRWKVLRLLLGGLTVGLCSVARAHGPAPSALAVVDADAQGPKMIRLTGGYARRADASRYQFLCPAAWGDDVVLPAAVIPGGPVVIAGGQGLYLVDAMGGVVPHPDPMAASPASDFAQLGGKLYVLRAVGANSEVLEVDATHVRVVFTDPGNWSAIAATANEIGLQRLTDTHVEQLRISPEGMLLARESAPAPIDPILVIARATSTELYSLVATATGRELGQIVGDQWKRIELASASIAGPVELANGDSFIAVDSVMARLAQPQSLLEGMPLVSCLGRIGESAYACTREGLAAVSAAGVGQTIFELSSMLPPELTRLSMDQQSLCTTQWEHFRFDLLALGVTLKDPPPAVSGPGQPSAAGASAAGTSADAVAGSSASAGAAGAPASVAGMGGAPELQQPSASAAPSGCSVMGSVGARSANEARAPRTPRSAFAFVFGACAALLRSRTRFRSGSGSPSRCVRP